MGVTLTFDNGPTLKESAVMKVHMIAANTVALADAMGRCEDVWTMLNLKLK